MSLFIERQFLFLGPPFFFSLQLSTYLIFNSKVCHHTGEMDTQSTYYREESDYIDFVNDEEGYRSSLSEWGYVKITLDDTSNE